MGIEALIYESVRSIFAVLPFLTWLSIRIIFKSIMKTGRGNRNGLSFKDASWKLLP